MEINKKMDLQVASLKMVLESLKLETIRYMAGGSGSGSGSGDGAALHLRSAFPSQRPSLPASPSLWESTGSGGDGSEPGLVSENQLVRPQCAVTEDAAASRLVLTRVFSLFTLFLHPGGDTLHFSGIKS